MEQTSKPYVIVVGVDYSETGDLALAHALEIGGAVVGSEVHVVNVTSLLTALPGMEYAPEAPVPIGEAEVQLRKHVERRLAEFRARSPEARGPARVVSHLRLEAPAQEIAQLASDLEADLVVVGTHSRRGLTRWVLGSVAETVVRLAPCPVLVARPKVVVEMPRIEPACPRCIETRRATNGREFWCEQHNERHGQRHTYHEGDRIATDGSMPLVFRS